MSAFDDPRYRVLAMRAAAVLGTTDPKMVNAIIAQWRCEVGANDIYPPNRNNPGNVARGSATDVGATFTVPDLATNPQPGNPIVTFSTPEYGADTYAKVLGTLPRYAGVRTAIASGDPFAFFDAVVASGYGPKTTWCLKNVYRDPADDAPVSIGTKPAGANAWVEATGLARLFSVDSNGILRPVPNPSGYRFEAWVGPKVTKTWAPGPKSALRYSAIFRKILSGSHKDSYIRVSDMGTAWHEQ